MILLQACLKDQDRVVLSKWGETAAFGIIVSELEKYHVPLLFLFFLTEINNVRWKFYEKRFMFAILKALVINMDEDIGFF